jgi:hypothetical protein
MNMACKSRRLTYNLVVFDGYVGLPEGTSTKKLGWLVVSSLEKPGQLVGMPNMAVGGSSSGKLT